MFAPLVILFTVSRRSLCWGGYNWMSIVLLEGWLQSIILNLSVISLIFANNNHPDEGFYQGSWWITLSVKGILKNSWVCVFSNHISWHHFIILTVTSSLRWGASNQPKHGYKHVSVVTAQPKTFSFLLILRSYQLNFNPHVSFFSSPSLLLSAWGGSCVLGGRCGAWGGIKEQEEGDTRSWVGCVCPYQSLVAFLVRKQWRWSSNGGECSPCGLFISFPLLFSLFPPPSGLRVMSLRQGWLIRPDITP